MDVRIDENALTVDLDDGRTITVPIVWFPRLTDGTGTERQNWRFIGDGIGIHWPDLDEDIKVQHLLEGRPSNESQSSLKRWLEERASRKAS